MKLSNGHPNPFEIAELCNLIASHLTRHDFVQLCCVCKDFSQRFRPFVWSSVVFKGGVGHSKSPSVQALVSNGQLIKHAELFCARTRTPSNEKDSNIALNASVQKYDEVFLAMTLLIACGSNLTSLKVVDHSDSGKIWNAVMERIRPMEGIPLLNGIQVLEISLTYTALDSCFKRLLTQPEQYLETAFAFAGVTELGLYGLEPSERYVSREEELSRWMKGPIKFQFRDLVRIFPNLKKLTLENINIVESQDDIEVATSELAAVTTAPLHHYQHHYQFHTLNFAKCGISAKQILQILRRTRDVRSLKIGSSASNMGDEGVLFSSLPMLAPLLTEYGQTVVDASGISTIFQGLPGLTRLYLSTGYRVVDRDLGILAKSCPGLQDLILPYCKSVTYIGVHHILRSCRRLKTLNLLWSPMAWDIFGMSAEAPFIPSAHAATAAATSATAPPSPAEFIPWACQDTLEHLLLTMSEDDPPEYLGAVRQRLQSLSYLRTLEIRCYELPVGMLIDLEHSEGPPSSLYPALETLELSMTHPRLTITNRSKLARSMPKLKQARNKSYGDPAMIEWDLKELSTMI